MSRPVEITVVGQGAINSDTNYATSWSDFEFFAYQGGYLTAPSIPNFDFGQGDFTLEGYFGYPSSDTTLFDFRSASGQSRLNIKLLTSLILTVNIGELEIFQRQMTGPPGLISLVKTSGQFSLYQNGTRVGATVSNNANLTQGPLTLINNYLGSESDQLHYNEIRISSLARYASNFTPLASSFVDDTDTQLLLQATGPLNENFARDNASSLLDTNTRIPVLVSAVNNASVSSLSKIGNGSVQLSRNSLDYLDFSIPYAANNNFTVETWLRVNSVVVDYVHHIISGNDYHGYIRLYKPQWGNGKHLIEAVMRGSSGEYTENQYLLPNTLNTTSWYHFALVKDGGNYSCFWDGVNIPANSSGAIAATGFISFNRIGSLDWSPNDTFSGYLDEFRISSTPRYSSNFVPSTVELQNDDDTLLLLHMDGPSLSTEFIDDSSIPPILGSASLSANITVACVATSTYSAKSTIASEFALQSSISRQRLAGSTLLSNFDIVSATAEIIILAGASLASNFTLELLANVIKTVESTSDCTSNLAVLAGKLKSTSVNLQSQTGLTALVEVILSVKGSAGVSVTSTMQATVTRIQNSNVSLNTLVSLDVDVSRYTKPDVGFMVLRENRSYSIINE